MSQQQTLHRYAASIGSRLKFLICIIAPAVPLYATNLQIGGNISSDTRWSADTVKVVEKVEVGDSATLSIDSGTYVEFQGHFPLIVHGRLMAMGGKNDSIFFTSNVAAGWQGIRFDSTASTIDTSILRYCHIRGGKLSDSVESDWGQGGGIFARSSQKIKIVDCLIVGNSAQREGGGIFCLRSGMIIRRCTIAGNVCREQGAGGIYCHSSTMVIDSCLIRGNVSYYYIGGMRAVNSKLSISRSHFLNNRAMDGSTGGISAASCTLSVLAVKIDSNHASTDGGGMFVSSSRGILDSLEIVNNSCGNSGGGIYLNNCGDLKITRSTIADNKAYLGGGIDLNGRCGKIGNCVIKKNCSDADGGGIHSSKGSSAEIRNCQIDSNASSNYWGGGIYASIYKGDSLIIINSRFKGNRAPKHGGALYAYGDGNLTLAGCVFQNNRSGTSAGGLYLNTLPALIVNVTFCNNIATDSGSAIMFTYSAAKLYNCIVWYNQWNDLVIIAGTSGYDFPSFYDCCIRGGLQAITIDSPIQFGGKYVNNISTPPLFNDTAKGDFSLRSGSPCINAGTPNLDTLEIPDLDINDNPRIVESRIDMGACEYQGSTSAGSSLHGKVTYPAFSLRKDFIRFEKPQPYESVFRIFDLRGSAGKTVVVPAYADAFPIYGLKPGVWIIQSMSTGVSRKFHVISR